MLLSEWAAKRIESLEKENSALKQRIQFILIDMQKIIQANRNVDGTQIPSLLYNDEQD